MDLRSYTDRWRVGDRIFEIYVFLLWLVKAFPETGEANMPSAFRVIGDFRGIFGDEGMENERFGVNGRVVPCAKCTKIMVGVERLISPQVWRAGLTSTIQTKKPASTVKVTAMCKRDGHRTVHRNPQVYLHRKEQATGHFKKT